MYQEELLYNHSSILITSTLFFLILLFNEIGFRVGRFTQSRTTEELKSLTGSLQASILGLLALLLGFTFSMSMQRFDNRSMALIDEANAIGTVLFRTELLNSESRVKAEALLAEYINLRVDIGQVDLTQIAKRQQYNQQITQIQQAIWAVAMEATDLDPRAVTTGAFINSLNGMIDAQGKRNALLQMHVPEVVLLLLFLVFVSSVGIIGYSSGLSGRRISAPTILIALLITMIVFIIIDLDRPKRGIIQVNQGLLHELQASQNR